MVHAALMAVVQNVYEYCWRRLFIRTCLVLVHPFKKVIYLCVNPILILKVQKYCTEYPEIVHGLLDVIWIVP